MEVSPAKGGEGGSDAAKPVSMRGRKKHKCSVCGNSAKSRCPFHSCKGCCVKAKNPCHIHVLKSIPAGETTQGLSATPTPHPAAATTFIMHHHPNDGLRLRTFKPSGIITKKEATAINYLRFQTLNFFTEGIIETEDQAFDRYMQNMALLEVIFAGDVQGLNGLSPKGHLLIEGDLESEKLTSGGVDATCLFAGLQSRLRSSSKRKEAHRQKLRHVIDRSLQRLFKGDQGDGMLEKEEIYTGFSDTRRDMKKIKVQSVEGKERLRKMDVFSSVTEKVKQMESQEDFNACLKIFEDNYVSRDTSKKSSTSEVSCPQELSTVRDKVSLEGDPKEPHVSNLKRDVLKLGTLNDGRVDSCGVLRSWWKLDSTQRTLDAYVDMPTSMLQAL
eukprot:c1715_g1_i1 orf=51-1208(+)